MRHRITACTDRAFVHAAWPLAHIKLRAATAANDNNVLPQGGPATRPRHLIPGLLASYAAQRAVRALLYASQRGHPHAAAQATKLIATLRKPSLTRAKVNVREILARAFVLDLRPGTLSAPVPSSCSPSPQACPVAGSQSPSLVRRSLSPKAPLHWF